MTAAPTYQLHTGSIPLLISMPHVGTTLAPEAAEQMTPVAQHLDDTDWHLEQLYAFAAQMGASILVPTYSRYVIDLNRPPTDENLYPGVNTTGLLPMDTFNEEPLYDSDKRPTEAEKARRRELYWQPYHQALNDELTRLHATHGHALLWEAHSIRAHIPRLFEGRLPDFNFGTSSDQSALSGLAQELALLAQQDGQYSAVANARFKGGYITRHYGAPERGIHAVQLELAQCTYMDETRPYRYDAQRAGRLTPVIQRCLEHALQRIKG